MHIYGTNSVGDFYDENGDVLSFEDIIATCNNIERDVTTTIYIKEDGEIKTKEVKCDVYYIDSQTTLKFVKENKPNKK